MKGDRLLVNYILTKIMLQAFLPRSVRWFFFQSSSGAHPQVLAYQRQRLGARIGDGDATYKALSMDVSSRESRGPGRRCMAWRQLERAAGTASGTFICIL